MKDNNEWLFRTITINPDEICILNQIELTKKCGNNTYLSKIFYLVPGMSLETGFIRF